MKEMVILNRKEQRRMVKKKNIVKSGALQFHLVARIGSIPNWCLRRRD